MPRGMYKRNVKAKAKPLTRKRSKVTQKGPIDPPVIIKDEEIDNEFLAHGSTHARDRSSQIQSEYEQLLIAANRLADYALQLHHGKIPPDVRAACAEVKMQVLLNTD